MAKRRTFSPEFKLRVILELLSGTKTNAQICRENQIASAVVSAWKEQFLAVAPAIFATPAQRRSERQRHYRHPGQSPLQVAGAPPGSLCYLDALQV